MLLICPPQIALFRRCPHGLNTSLGFPDPEVCLGEVSYGVVMTERNFTGSCPLCLLKFIEQHTMAVVLDVHQSVSAGTKLLVIPSVRQATILQGEKHLPQFSIDVMNFTRAEQCNCKKKLMCFHFPERRDISCCFIMSF